MKQIPPLKDFRPLLSRLPAGRLRAVLAAEVGPAPGGRYLHYEELRHREPPSGLSTAEWWLAVKLARSQFRRELPLRDAAGRPFGYVPVDAIHEMLHRIDQKSAGRIQLPEEATSEDSRDRYIVNSLIEEAITSSQMEGASTTRAVATEMLRSGRKARGRSETMILNNFSAIEQLRGLAGRPLDPHTVLTLHATLTRDTLDDADSVGRLQQPGEQRVQVVDNRTNRVLFTPPPAEQLPQRLQQMCEFANGRLDAGQFTHPVLRAMLLHFWLAHDHPFAEGNGRTARALFYWAMLANDYWLFEYVSISAILKRSFAQYAQAYQFSESDENDLTYFFIFHLRAILQAIESLETHLQEKVRQVREVEAMLRADSGLNHRQLALLSHALRHPGAEYTIRSHQRSHRVAYATARADLAELAGLGYLDETLRGKAKNYLVAREFSQRIAEG